MDTDAAVALTQDRLAEEGGTMGELLGHFRNRVSPVLIGDPQWDAHTRVRRQAPHHNGRPAIRFRAAAACT